MSGKRHEQTFDRVLIGDSREIIDSSYENG
jgi:hypothetical protein